MDIKLLGILASFLSFWLGLIVYRQDKDNSINRSFAVFSFFSAIWALALYFYVNPIFLDSLFWIKFVYFCAFGLISSSFFLSFVFPFGSPRSAYLPILLYTLIAIPFIYLLFFTNLWVQDVVFKPWGPHTILGPAYIYWGLFNLLTGIWIFANFYFKYKIARGREKAQLKYIFLGIYILAAGTLIVDVLHPVLTGESGFFWASSLFTLPFLISISYAIVKHRLMDIRLVVARAVAYSLLVTIIAAFYTSSMFLIGLHFYPAAMNGNQLLASVILTLIIAFTFQPLRRLLERVTDNIFFKERYDSHELLGALSKIMSSTIVLEELTKRVLGQLIETMKISRGAFILVEGRKIYDIIELKFSQPFKMKNEDVFELIGENKPLVFEELAEGRTKNIMRKYDLTFVILLRAKRENIGLLCLAEKASGDMYTPQDIKVLEILAPEISVAIQNAEAYEEIKKFTITLREQIKAATKELRLTNKELRKVSALKDEFVSIASHELRTPLSAIGGSVSTILEGYAGRISGKTKEFLIDAYEENARLIRLVNNLLNISRIESGRMVFDIKTVNLPNLILEIIESFELQAKKQKIKLSYEEPKKKLPQVKADSDRVREILVNLIGNALKFTEKGSVTVSNEIKNKMVITAITDTGPGIKEADQRFLFQKFAKLVSLKTSIEEGVGLGLYICKNLVEAMGGKIWLKSRVEQGSTFFFSLPKTS